jgi:branched-chain amino acid transport system substrate-binding protein
MRTRFSILIVVVFLASLLMPGCAATPTPAAPAPTTAPVANTAPTEAPAAPTVIPPTAAPVEPTKAPAKPAPEFIDIGGSVPLTGKYGSLGSQVKVGYEYAVADVNAAGGIYVKEFDKKIPLRLTIYDDTSDPTKAVSNMETLFSQQNVSVYLGGAASDMHAATSAIAEKNKVPYLGISFALWKIHQQGYKYLFSPFVKSPDQAEGVFKFLNDAVPADQRPTKVAVFQEKTDWGIEEGTLIKQYATQYGYTIVDYEEYAPGTKDYSSMITKAKNAGADMLLGMPSPPDGMAIMKQLAQLGWTPKFTMFNRAPDGNTWGSSLAKTGDFVAFYPGWHHGEKYPGVDSINERYQKDNNRPADVLVGPSYTCVQILADAITRAGTLDRDAIRDAIAATNMTTVMGPVSFRADGTGVIFNPVVQWINGKQELVWPKEQQTADFVYPAPAFDKR